MDTTGNRMRGIVLSLALFLRAYPACFSADQGTPVDDALWGAPGRHALPRRVWLDRLPRGRAMEWRWREYAQGEYVGHQRIRHVPVYRLRVDDV